MSHENVEEQAAGLHGNQHSAQRDLDLCNQAKATAASTSSSTPGRKSCTALGCWYTVASEGPGSCCAPALSCDVVSSRLRSGCLSDVEVRTSQRSARPQAVRPLRG